MLISVACALAAALLFALTSNLQREAAAAVPLHAGGPVRLLILLVRTPRWLAGSSVSVLGFGLQALALAGGSVIAVQALIATNVAFALAIESRRQRRGLRPAQALGAALVLAGVAVLVLVGHPTEVGAVDVTAMAEVSVVLVLAACGGLIVPRRRAAAPHVVPRLMAAAAGVCFAVDAVFLKAAADAAEVRDWLLAVIALAGFAAASVCANLLVQRAYQIAPLREVLPALAATEPLAAFVVAVTVLHERVAAGGRGPAGVGMGLAALLTGIVLGTRASDLRITPAGLTRPG